MSPDINFLKREASYINGEWVSSSKFVQVVNPATGETVGRVPRLDGDQIRQSIQAASDALEIWKSRVAGERSTLMHRWADLININEEALATLLTLEQGKPIREARAEISVGAEYIRWNAEEGRRAYGETIPTNKTGQRPITIRQPIGVAVAITPWNFPNSMITRKVAPALAAGCTIVIKPPTETPLSALALAVLADEAGIPPGVLNVVTGSAEDIGAEFTQNEIVKALSFTGSTQVGKLLMKQCSDTLKKVSLELGGNAPFVVFDDADIRKAAKGAAASRYRNAGQTCICANRILVQASVHAEFMASFKEEVEKIVVGNGLVENVTMGPLINARAVSHVEELVADALSKGAKLITGGNRHSEGELFYMPTILDQATPGMRVFREEIFGPVAPVIQFSSEAEAIALANDTEYGLASYLYSRDVGRVWRVAEALESGMVGINDTTLGIAEAPFGGVKESGQGREGGRYGVEEFSEIKYLLMGGLDS